MGSDQSKPNGDKNSGARRNYVRHQSPPTRPAQDRPMIYQRAQSLQPKYRPETTQANGPAESEHGITRQPYTQGHLSSPTLYPQLDNVAPDYPRQSLSQLHKHEIPKKAEYGAHTAQSAQATADTGPSTPKPSCTAPTAQEAAFTTPAAPKPACSAAYTSPIAQAAPESRAQHGANQKSAYTVQAAADPGPSGPKPPYSIPSIPTAQRAAYTTPATENPAYNAAYTSPIAQAAPESRAQHGASTAHVKKRSAYTVQAAADPDSSAPKPTYTSSAQRAAYTIPATENPAYNAAYTSPIAQAAVESRAQQGAPTAHVNQRSAYTVQAAADPDSSAPKPTCSTSSAQRAAYTTPATGNPAYNAAYSSIAETSAAPVVQGGYTSPAPQKPAYGGAPRLNSVSDEGFVLINLPKSPPPEVVSMPTAPPLGFQNKKKTAARRPRSKCRGPTAAADALNINCPTCDEQYTENIFQCRDGHSACENCKEQGVLCRLCGLPITDVRNFSLQEYVCEIRTPCYNAGEGCMLSFKIGDMWRHLKECPFQEMDCPLKAIYGRCSWRGKMSQLVSHFDINHPENRQGNIDQEMLLPNIYHDDRYVHLIELGCYKFLAHLCVSEAQRRIYITVQLIGTKNNASKWTYDIHVYNKKEPRRKYQFSDVCYPTGTSIEKVFREANCAVLPLPLAMTFFNEGALTYKFFIRKEFEGMKESRSQTRAKAWRNSNNNYLKNSN